MKNHETHEPVVARGFRAVGDLLRTIGWFVAVHAGVGCLALALAAWYYARTLDDGPWALLGGWTLGAVYALVGFWGGAAVGLLASVITLVASFERACRAWLERMAEAPDDPSFPSFSRDDLSSRTRELADWIVRRAIGRIPIPGLIMRLISSQVCKVLFDEFLTDCEQRGVTVIRFATVRAWLLARGLALATAPLLARLFLARWLITGSLAVLVILAVTLALRG